MANISPVEVQETLSGVDYPADKQQLMDMARDNGADQEVLDALEGIPDQEYGSPTDVTSALSDSGQV
jgi:hypothetical protein